MEQFTTLKVSDDPTLEKIPPLLPITRKIEFNNFKILKPKIKGEYTNLYPPNSENPHWQFVERSYVPSGNYLNSFKDLPRNLPNLEKISFSNSNITNFEELSAEMPNLKGIGFSNCYIHSLLEIPINHLVFRGSTINSFEGLVLPVPQHAYMDEDGNSVIEGNYIYLENCTIRSLGGVSRSTIQAILIAILSQDYEDQSKNWFRIPNKIKLDLPPTALKLIQEAVDLEIEIRYSPKLNKQWPSIWNGNSYRIPNYFLDEWQIFGSGYYDKYQEMYNASKHDWIYGFGLTERLFISEKLDLLHEYYKKTSLQLAQEYIADTESFPPEQIERLVHEIDPETRKLLENNLPPDNPVIAQITSKFSFKTQNGLRILK